MSRLWKRLLVAGAILVGGVIFAVADQQENNPWHHRHIAQSSTACYYGCQIVDHDDDFWLKHPKKECFCRD